jgi:hypothetical protein
MSIPQDAHSGMPMITPRISWVTSGFIRNTNASATNPAAAPALSASIQIWRRITQAWYRGCLSPSRATEDRTTTDVVNSAAAQAASMPLRPPGGE